MAEALKSAREVSSPIGLSTMTAMMAIASPAIATAAFIPGAGHLVGDLSRAASRSPDGRSRGPRGARART